MKYRVSWPWVLILTFVVFPISYIYAGLLYEARLSFYARAFSTIGDRAIQLDRIGSVGLPLHIENQISIERSVIDNPETLSCSSKVIARVSDPRENSSTAFLISGIFFPTIYLIYNGRPPDFNKFFNKDTALQLLGPQKHFLSDRVDPDLIDKGYDVSSDFRRLIMDRKYIWHSTECDKFTYTIFKEIYFGG